MPMGGSELKTSSKLRDQLMAYLEKQGYNITEESRLIGKSGVEHTFDMLAQRDDGFTNYTIAVCIVPETDEEVGLSTIFDFANKAYDTGVRDRFLVTPHGLSQEAKQLAQKQRVKIIDGEHMRALLKSEPTVLSKPDTPLKFGTKSQLLESLVSLGYRVVEKAKTQGKSGVEYTFDILAYIDNTHVTHSLGIDIIDDEGEVGLEKISVFDTKAYDVGIDDKAIAVVSDVSPEVKLFAQQQQIKILRMGREPAAKSQAVAEEPTSVEKKPAESGKTEAVDRAPGKLLRQMVQPKVLQLIPEVLARRYNAIPLAISGNTLQVAMVDSADVFALEAFSTKSKMRVKPIAADSKEIREAIDLNYKAYGEIEKHISRISIPSGASDDRLAIDAAIDAPLAQALNLIIEEAIKARSSDIHVEPEENRLRVRYRIDGTLQDMMSLPMSIHRALISRIKILADMNIADHHRAQDGQFSTDAKGRATDVRVATAPTVHGEMAVMRLLDKSLATRGLVDIGLLPESLEKYESMLKVPYGMILISGPTGAGKTTSLYASLNSIDTMERNIITIEDPAEYRFKDINQIQVNPQAGITFASGLRAILRLDPDVIMVGEIRDAETAGIATQAALTGHLMLTSIHSNDTVGVLFRLLDLGVEPFLVASAVTGVVAQRMVRRICPDCSRLIEAPPIEQLAYEKEMGEKKKEFLYGTGCESCAYAGYMGRTGIFEILVMYDNIRTMLVNGASSSELRTQAIKDGMATMMKDGMTKVQMGITTPAEVLRSAFYAG